MVYVVVAWKVSSGLASMRSGELCFASLAGGNMSGRLSIGLLGAAARALVPLLVGCGEHVNDIGAIGSPTDGAFLADVVTDSAEEAKPPADAPCPSANGAIDAGWHLVFEDQFEGLGGPKADVWKLEIGPADDHQRQYNTDRPENVRLDGNGNLLIEAREESYMGMPYTSARLDTQGHRTFTYGRFEARMKVAAGGPGLWSQWWMLGADFPTVGYPDCGDVTITDHLSENPTSFYSGAYGPGFPPPATSIYAQYTLPGGASLGDDFHVFRVDWEPDRLTWYIDDHAYYSRSKSDLDSGMSWVFGHPMFLILFVAVGGDEVNSIDRSIFPATTLIDYVRVCAHG
jgi:beta-glucanase (GH16 family)